MAILRLEPIENYISHKCGKCKAEMVLPDWVGKTEYDKAVFQCPKCDKEAEIDISDYPKMRLKIYPLCQKEFSEEKGWNLSKNLGIHKPLP